MKITIFSQISIDGKLTLGAGTSSKPLFGMFNQDDMEYIHRFRGKVDGIMVGRNTIQTDNPFLTNRFESNKNPVRIVPTSTLNIPMDSNILSDHERTIIVTTESARDEEKIRMIRERGKECIVCGDENVNFIELCKQLEEKFNIRSIMVEGGGQLNWHVFHHDLVDEIILMQLPIIIGGSSNVTLVDGEGYRDVTMTKKFEVVEVQPRENYTLLRYKKAAV